ncbi:hypothetical protein ROE7235_01684 [Roseibaca ekhonensis]|uniref:YjiS-like domain-containing protein n=1 Tax=Roseinatronobacter ekhonensis TaxID=254356 RepID=A0A3B0M8E8_9RHOB|nr:DUF1127 domain-containing protein [Roseibaca ekhonensis]SUZ31933.1 hypothetical protein ROE7235_01684 [Roseibaca ekhonensis]
MAYVSNSAPQFAGLMARLHNLRDALRTRMAQHARYRQTRDELQALSSRELADLGIHRSEIARIAHEAARGI